VSRFEPFGPFDMPVSGVLIDRKRESEFWKKVEAEAEGLPDAVGCYIFAIRAGRGARPWYVGKSEKTSFRKESWTPHKLLVYSEGLQQLKIGTPLLYFVAKRTKGGRFAKKGINGISAVRALEEILIGTCLLRNSRLLNKRTTKHYREIEVPGYMNESPGARTVQARNIAKLLGVSKKVVSKEAPIAE
jgi:hypothetical protein